MRKQEKLILHIHNKIPHDDLELVVKIYYLQKISFDLQIISVQDKDLYPDYFLNLNYLVFVVLLFLHKNYQYSYLLQSYEKVV